MMDVNKGIILAGGSGSRLYPLSWATNKQLLPIYNKPVIYYPLTTLMLAGIKEICIISSKRDIVAIERLLGTGEQFGIQCVYKIQEHPRGLPEAFLIAEDFLKSEASMLILGDNFFYGNQLLKLLQLAKEQTTGAHLFLHPVDDPSAYGVISLNKDGSIQSVVEKPREYISNLAITGLYIFDHLAPQYTRKLTPSTRGELEITDLIKLYLNNNRLSYSTLGRGYVWHDTGTPQSLLQVSFYVEMIENRQGLLIASPEEVAFRLGYIDYNQFTRLVNNMVSCAYKQVLQKSVDIS